MTATLTPEGYISRVSDRAIAETLAAMPAVVIEGPKGCGKTWSGRNFARSEVLFDQDLNARRSVSTTPGYVLAGQEPRLLDEWQLADDVWNQVRHACDEGHRAGRFLLTGSAVPVDDVTRHSGAGRIGRVRMRPMSLRETGESTGEVSIESLLDGAAVAAHRPAASFADVVDAICRGGWPRHLNKPVPEAQLLLRNYLGEICRTDISSVDGVVRDPAGVQRLVASVSRNIATMASYTKLAREASGERGLNRTTATEYVRSLERLFIVEDLPHWSTHLRSRATLLRSPKRHFVDPSLAAAATGATPDRLLGDLEALGLLFESLVVRDLRIYGQRSDAAVYHYHDSDKLEADMIVEARDGRWMAVEAKLGGEEWIEEAASSLLRLSKKVDTEKVGTPSKLLIITATGYGYDRPDGTSVLPLTALGP